MMANNPQLMVFSKNLLGPSLGEIARRLRAMGVSSLDLTVRAGGHVEPSRAREELPRAQAELHAQGVEIGQITTNLTDAHHDDARAVLETAARCGIGFYKLGYFAYQGFGTLRKARDEARDRVRDLAQLSAEIGICGGFHNHSHNFIGASVPDIDFVLSDQSAIGVYFDPAHASIEGGISGWEIGLDLLQERIVMLAVKDYAWVENGQGAGGRRFKVQWVPLQNGNVPWPRVVEHLQTIGFDGPISLHSEYRGAHSFRDLCGEELWQQTARDTEVFRGWVEAARRRGENN